MKNFFLILVKGLSWHLEMKSEIPIAKLAGLEGYVEHSVQPGAGSGQGQPPPSRAGSVCSAGGRGRERSQAWLWSRAPFTEVSGFNRLVF